MEYAFVSGGTSGIGLSIAEHLLQDGRHVLINYAHDETRAQTIGERLSVYEGRAELVRCDMSQYEGVKQIVTCIKQRDMKLTYLVLNYGATDRTPFGSITEDNWEGVLRANVSVPFFLIQDMFRDKLFAEQASILCVSSLMASIPHAISPGYGISKAGLSALCTNLVKFLSPAGIRINAVEPGFVDTAWQKQKHFAQRVRIENKTALGRFAQPDEIAQLCIATLKNTYMTGCILPIGGGYGQMG